jgi:hypothetical protein
MSSDVTDDDGTLPTTVTTSPSTELMRSRDSVFKKQDRTVTTAKSTHCTMSKIWGPKDPSHLLVLLLPRIPRRTMT